MNQIQNYSKLAASMKHFGQAFLAMAEAFETEITEMTEKVEVKKQTPVVSAPNPIKEAATTTKIAKEAADKEAESVEETKAEEKPKKAKAKKETKKDDGFDEMDREARIQHLRERMPLVAQKLNGDREKTYAFLRKYKAQKVNELSDEDLVNLKNDIEVFLAGPDALDI